MAGQVLLSLAISWIVYVPAHGLLRAAGCAAAGGTVSELAIAPVYGAALLRRAFPFVVASSEHAARLTMSWSEGSDLVILAADFAPFLLTVLVGIPLLRSRLLSPSASGGWRWWRPWIFGPPALLAAAPAISIAGAYFEMGTVILTRGYSAAGVGGLDVLRSDDLLGLLWMLYEKKIVIAAAPAVNWSIALSVIAVSLMLSLALASATYRLGIIWGSLLRRLRGS